MKDCLLMGAWVIGCIGALVAVCSSVFGVMFGVGALWLDAHPLAGAIFALGFIFTGAAALRALFLWDFD